MVKGLQLENGEYGRRAVVASVWSDDMLVDILENEVVELELNDGRGWRGSDISFLKNLPQLKSLKIIDLRIRSVAPIHSLHELRALEVITYCQTEILFSEFPRLKECALEWRPKAASLFDCRTLNKLFVNRYDQREFTPFTRLDNLESLAALNAPLETLRGIGILKRLRTLRLAGLGCLTSLTGIEALKNLEELDINTCQNIGSIEEVGFLPRLQKLQLNNDGDIKSLKPLSKIGGLISVGFYESTNILDGDLSPLLHQRNLVRVAFKNRQHYSHRREDLVRRMSG